MRLFWAKRSEPLVTYELVEFDKQLDQLQGLRQIADHFRAMREIFLNQ